MMKRSMMMIVATVIFAGASTFATGPVMHEHEGKHKCIMFGADKWQKLGLSDAQQAEVAKIQASCEQDHNAAVSAGKDASASVDAHEARLKTVLTPEQYETWTSWCAKKMEKHDSEHTKPMH